MPVSGKIGAIITGTTVRLALRDTVKKWAPDYLAEVGAQHGRARGDLPVFRSYVSLVDLTKFSEDQIPSCVIVAVGTDNVQRHGKLYDASWTAGVGCVVSGQDSENTYELCELYVAATRALVLQHKSLGGVVTDTTWTGERYDELTSNDERTITAGVVQFTVAVEGVLDGSLGLLEPSVDATVPPGDWPTADTVGTLTTAKRS